MSSAEAAEPVFYLIPGLGADERIFRNLRLRGKVRVINWLSPHPAETLENYVARMAAPIPSNQPCFVVGVSFGGIVAQEIKRLCPSASIVLVSSVPDAASFPLLLRLIGRTKVYRLVPPQLLKLFPRVGQWYFSARNGEDYQLFKQILRDTDPAYARWAIDRLLNWRGTSTGSCFQIRGTQDQVFPPGSAPLDYRIPGGGHFIIVSHGAEISQILNTLAATKPLRL